jgi:hypothetical protein
MFAASTTIYVAKERMKFMPRLEADDDPTQSLSSAQDNVNVPGRVEPGEAVGLVEHAHVRQLAVLEAAAG